MEEDSEEAKEEECQTEGERKKKREIEEIAWRPQGATTDPGPIKRLGSRGMRKDVEQFDERSGILGIVMTRRYPCVFCSCQ